jgi:hypothetical protein
MAAAVAGGIVLADAPLSVSQVPCTSALALVACIFRLSCSFRLMYCLTCTRGRGGVGWGWGGGCVWCGRVQSRLKQVRSNVVSLAAMPYSRILFVGCEDGKIRCCY